MRAYIVEDSKVIREGLMETLQELAGVECVGFAESEQEGRDWLARNPDQWDVAIVDLFLKQGNGLGVIEACGTRSAMQRVVVLSNYATNDIRERCSRLGADAVFDKSNELDALFEFCVADSSGSQGQSRHNTSPGFSRLN